MKRGEVEPYTGCTATPHLQEPFGPSRSPSWRPPVISDGIDEQLDDGAAPKSVRARHGLLFSIMKHGQQRMRLRPDNPCEPTELPELDMATSQA